MHLLAIVLLGLLIGSLGLVSSLGIQQDGYSNINKKGKNPDFVCREIPKKQPRDIELGHYARTNDMTACPKDNHVHAGLLPDQTKKVQSHAQDDSNNVGATSNMTEDQMMLAATLYADKKKNDPITDDEIKQYIVSGAIDVSEMLNQGLNQGNKEGFGMNKPNPQQVTQAVSLLRSQIAGEKDPAKKAQGIKGIRFMLKLKELTESQEPAKPDELQPWNKNKSKCSNYKANYGCLNIDTQNYNPINNERCGSRTLEGHSNRYTHQMTRAMIPRGRREDYILKTKIVPPVCPKCPDCPALDEAIKLLQEKNKEKDEEGVEDELKENELEDSPSALARANEKRKRTPEGQRNQDPAQHPAPSIKEAAERHEPKKAKAQQASGAQKRPAGRKGAGYPNEGAFSGSSSFPIPYLNSFSAFGR